MVRSPYKGFFYIIFILNVITIHLRAPFCSRSFWYKHGLNANPEDRISRDGTHIICLWNCVFCLQETPVIMYVIDHLCHLEPQSHNTCTRLYLSAGYCDQITSVVEYRVYKSKPCRPWWHAIFCGISPGCSCLLMSSLRNTWHKWMYYSANMIIIYIKIR